MITKEEKTKVFSQVQRHKTDVGSPESQVGVLTARIKQLTEHLKENKHDNHGRRGLIQMVGRRKKLLAYLQRKDFAAYQALIAKLGLRK
ncbi:MAG: 30S ribosomal protein S15 [Candidatus Woesebacteria bacterium]|jgi:small subunit ribosomal protein S15